MKHRQQKQMQGQTFTYTIIESFQCSNQLRQRKLLTGDTTHKKRHPDDHICIKLE